MDTTIFLLCVTTPRLASHTIAPLIYLMIELGIE